MSLVVYGLIGLMPGDPIDLMLSSDPSLSAADVARLKAVYGLDRPLWERWSAWAMAAATGDLGYSRLYGQPVVSVLLPRLAATAVLMGGSLAIAIAIAVPLGVGAALRPGGWLDRMVDLLAFAAASLPSFWLALLMIVLFAVELGWLPAGGDGGAAARGAFGRLPYLVLPLATMALLTVGALVRFVRISVAEALTHDFIRTARAKGCTERRVVWSHAFGHAVPPLLTIVALHMGSLLSGALVVETVFAWPGMGKLIYDAVIGNDFGLALAALLLVTATTLLANLLADLAHAWLDPRISLDA